MVLNAVGTPLVWTELPDRQPGPGQIRVQVLACGVCRTDRHVVDGELPSPHVPIIPGHEIVGQANMLTGAVTVFKVAAMTRAVVDEIAQTDLAPIIKARPAIAAELGEIMAIRQAAAVMISAGAGAGEVGD